MALEKKYAEDMPLSVQHKEFAANTLRLHIYAVFFSEYFV